MSTPAPARLAPDGADVPRALSLTFDDGPDATWTPLMLEQLAYCQISATFFMMGGCVSAGAATLCLESTPYALVIADWLLPDGSGGDVADAAAKLGAKTFIISGYIRGLPDGAKARHELLTKRLGPTEIVAAVRQAIGCPVDEA